MAVDKKVIILIEAILFSFSLMVFSFFIHHKLPYSLISFAALIWPSYLVGKSIKSLSGLKKITGEFYTVRISVIYSFIGLLSGISIAAFYRWSLNISLFPVTIHYFVIIAAAIGGLEELIFRGFLQDFVKSSIGPFSIFFSSLSHTFYKCCLFLVPLAAADIDIGFLAISTFITGMIFGAVKHLSNSILPSLIAHIIFDILVYAEYIKAPWWVW